MLIISPWSRKMRNGKPNPKSPELAWWKKLIGLLRESGYATTQIGESGEELIGADETILNFKLSQIVELICSAETFVSVDNFLPHLVRVYELEKRGVVVWGRSDPKIFGYPENINLLKSEKNLKSNQFGIWEEIEYDPNVFVEPEKILEAIKSITQVEAN